MKYELHLKTVAELLSTCSLRSRITVPGNVAYAASKRINGGITKTAAIGYASKKYQINAVCPAFADAMVQNSIMQNKVRRTPRRSRPHASPQRDEEVTSMSCFISRSKNTFMNRQPSQWRWFDGDMRFVPLYTTGSCWPSFVILSSLSS
jgi:NAD(P)-dependent dehydrogenase (short-subunit alcohol dehydrogenase family)